MGTITERSVLGSFALAKAHRGRFFDNEFLGLKSCALVGAVAERTVAGSTARAPPIGARFQFHFYRFGISRDWSFGHKDGLFVERCGGFFRVTQKRAFGGF